MEQKVTEERRKGAVDRRTNTIDRRQFIDIGWALENERRLAPEDRRRGPEDRRGS